MRTVESDQPSSEMERTSERSERGPAQLPAERLWNSDRALLADGELLSLLVGSGTADRSCHDIATDLLRQLGGLNQLAIATPSELATVPGIGMMRAARISAAFELARRWHVASPSQPINSAQAVFALLHGKLSRLAQEVFVVLALDAKGRLVGEFEVAKGSLYSVEVFPREVFRPLIRVAAAAGVIAHNHPSRDPQPSEQDIALTRRLRDAAALLGIPLVDHVIVAGDEYYSFAQECGDEF